MILHGKLPFTRHYSTPLGHSKYAISLQPTLYASSLCTSKASIEMVLPCKTLPLKQGNRCFEVFLFVIICYLLCFQPDKAVFISQWWCLIILFCFVVYLTVISLAINSQCKINTGLYMILKCVRLFLFLEPCECVSQRGHDPMKPHWPIITSINNYKRKEKNNNNNNSTCTRINSYIKKDNYKTSKYVPNRPQA